MTRAQEHLQDLRRATDVIRNGRKSKFVTTPTIHGATLPEVLIDVIISATKTLEAMGYDADARLKLMEERNHKDDFEVWF